MTIRRASPSDAHDLARLRVALAVSENNPGIETQTERADYHARCAAYFATRLPSERLFVWVAEVDGDVVASAAMLVHESLPRSYSRDSVLGVPLDARLRSVFVEERVRRRGIARALVVEAIEYARKLGCFRITLGASQMGRALYDSLGFVALEREMSLRL
jgi:GNAT superfamily N-acetyltransferase